MLNKKVIIISVITAFSLIASEEQPSGLGKRKATETISTQCPAHRQDDFAPSEGSLSDWDNESEPKRLLLGENLETVNTINPSSETIVITTNDNLQTIVPKAVALKSNTLKNFMTDFPGTTITFSNVAKKELDQVITLLKLQDLSQALTHYSPSDSNPLISIITYLEIPYLQKIVNNWNTLRLLNELNKNFYVSYDFLDSFITEFEKADSEGQQKISDAINEWYSTGLSADQLLFHGLIQAPLVPEELFTKNEPITVSMNRDGTKFLFYSAIENSYYLFDRATNDLQPFKKLDKPSESSIQSFSPDGKQIWAYTPDTLYLFDSTTGKTVYSTPHMPGPVLNFGFENMHYTFYNVASNTILTQGIRTGMLISELGNINQWANKLLDSNSEYHKNFLYTFNANHSHNNFIANAESNGRENYILYQTIDKNSLQPTVTQQILIPKTITYKRVLFDVYARNSMYQFLTANNDVFIISQGFGIILKQSLNKQSYMYPINTQQFAGKVIDIVGYNSADDILFITLSDGKTTSVAKLTIYQYTQAIFFDNAQPKDRLLFLITPYIARNPNLRPLMNHPLVKPFMQEHFQKLYPEIYRSYNIKEYLGS